MALIDLVKLNTASAETAGQKDGSRRGVSEVYQAAVAFNSAHRSDYTEEQARAQIKRLDLIMSTAGLWLTSKQPKPEGPNTSPEKADKNRKRWIALADVCEQCSRELIAMGLRPLHGHWSANPVAENPEGHNYWLERLDPEHRPGPVMSIEYREWVRLAPSDRTFFDHVTAKRHDLTHVQYNKGAEDAEAIAARQRRRQARVLIQGGVLRRMDETTGEPGAVFTTRGLRTEFSGDGFGIFVWDQKKRLYAGRHVVGNLHHSSHRGGQPVLCAGEIATDDAGRLLMVTSKTGHYTTTPTEFAVFVAYLREQHAVDDRTFFIPDTSGRVNGTWQAFRADQPVAKGVVTASGVPVSLRLSNLLA